MKSRGALARYERQAPNAKRAHPDDDHFLPLFFALGAGGFGAGGTPVQPGYVTREVMYGILGVGYNSVTEAYAPVGVGAEVALADNLSLKAEYQYQYDFDDSAQDAHVGKIGFNWHF